jgi:hypothetical protein
VKEGENSWLDVFVLETGRLNPLETKLGFL